jgi:hypothetical protein
MGENSAIECPRRIQRSRAKGWKMPLNTTYVGRPSMWGNFAAWRIGATGERAVAEFRRWVAEEASWAWRGRATVDLRGKNLACWCALDQPCHADVLLEIANAESPAAPPAAQPRETDR